MEETGSKFCKCCQKDVALSGWQKCRARTDGLQVYCRECMGVYMKRNGEQQAKRRKEVELRLKAEAHAFIQSIINRKHRS